RVKVHMAPAVGSENNARSTKSSSQERRWLRRYASFERGGGGRLPPAPPNHCSSPAHWWSWQADFCDGCHHEPAADLGSCPWSTGRYVPRGKGGGRARRAARLFPGIWRTPREKIGQRSRIPPPHHDACLLSGRLHANPQSACTCAT